MPRWAWSITRPGSGHRGWRARRPCGWSPPSTGSTPVRRRAGARPPARIAGCLATYPWRCCGGPVAHPRAGGLLAAEEPAQLAQHLDEGVGVVVAGALAVKALVAG